MKKSKIILIILSILSLIIFSIITIYSIKDFANKEIKISTFISPVLTICNILITSSLCKNKEKIVAQYQFDDFFTDRNTEFKNILLFLFDNTQKIYYITGENGIGKSMLLKETADRINKKKKEYNYSVLYLNLKNNNNILNNIKEILDISTSINIEKICKTLKKEWKKNWVIFIDEVDEISYLSVKEFANSIYYYARIKTVISYNGNLSFMTEKPSLFTKKEINELFLKYGLEIDNDIVEKIFLLSKGLPVYVRFLLNQYEQSKSIDFTNNSDIKIYIGNLISQQLNCNDRKSLSIICCHKNISNCNLLVKEFKEIYHHNIIKLINLAIVEIKDEYIMAEKDILNICSEYLKDFENESFISIFNYYMHKPHKLDLALLALLSSKHEIKDTVWIYETIKNKIDYNDFAYIIRMGDLDRNSKINPFLYDNLNLYQYIQIAYFNALLAQGLYNEAEKVINTYDFSLKGRKGIVCMESQNDFDIHYSIADLYHLTNRFEDSAIYCDLLLNKIENKNNYNRAIYLKAHCIRHIGKDYYYSISLFRQITEEKNNLNISPQIYIRSMYSILSIQMLWGIEKSELYTNFDTLHKLAKTCKNEQILCAYIDRHYLRYLIKYEKSINEAISIGENILSTLEKNNSRIKYDYYFELGELYRLQYSENQSKRFYEKSLQYYSLAIDFAQDSKDYNLESMCQLGIILLQMENRNVRIDIKKTTEIIDKILIETKNKSLFLNHCYATFVSFCVNNEHIPEKIYNKFNTLKFNDLYNSSLLHNAGKSFFLKLVVM